MLTPEDRRAIDGLFQRLDAVEREAREPRDPEAEALIQRRIAQQPSAPYYMAQTVIVQQQALEAAEQRINELEDQVKRNVPARRGRYADDSDTAGGPWNRGYGQGFGGGFLAGAMQTALGVTGGILLGSALGGLFAGTANASEQPQDSNADDNGADTDSDTDGGDAGGDFGDFGGGDFGGGDFGGGDF
jgi:hypothetical protein